MNIILIGFKNSGKTSVGKSLAAALSLPFVDTDQLIENHFYLETQKKLTIREIFKEKGEAYFRELEKKMLTTLPADSRSVLATGGGVVLDADNRAWLRAHGKIIYLTASFAAITERNTLKESPAFAERDSLQTIYDARKKNYEQLADWQINTENKSITEIVAETIMWLNQSLRENNHGQQ